jgi:hypothetical protein
MTKPEMQQVLSTHLAKFRNWSYAELSRAVEQTRRDHDCLEHLEETAPDGTDYQVEFNVFWNDKPNQEVRVIGSLFAEPSRPLLGFIPIYTPDVTDSFIMAPDGRFLFE